MTVVYNITFIVSPGDRTRLENWLRADALPRLFSADSHATAPRLHVVREVGGEAPGPEHGLSIALQAEFADERDARTWREKTLPPVLADFREKLGPQALYFDTLLEVLHV